MLGLYKIERMPFVNEHIPGKVNIYYEDSGSGRPLILIHGWPLSGDMWEYQVAALTGAGFRCITYDRRGFGRSGRPYEPYDYSTLADDLHDLIQHLELEEVTLAGFSMGGGEVVRYLSKYGASKISKAILISSVVPYLLKTGNHPEGVDANIFDEMIAAIYDDRPAFLKEFGRTFYGVSLINSLVSDAVLQWTQGLAVNAFPKATIDCVRSFSETDFREELSSLSMPVLIIHGDHDKIVPVEATSQLAAGLIANNEFIIYQGAPHGLFLTHKERLNDDIITFMRK